MHAVQLLLLLTSVGCAATTRSQATAFQTFDDDPVMPDVVVPGTRITVDTSFDDCTTRSGEAGHPSQTSCTHVPHQTKLICDHPACTVEDAGNDKKPYGRDYQVTLGQPGSYPMRVQFSSGETTKTVELKTLMAAFPTTIDVTGCTALEEGAQVSFRAFIGREQIRKPRDVTAKLVTGEPCAVDAFFGTATCPIPSASRLGVTIAMPGKSTTAELDCARP